MSEAREFSRYKVIDLMELTGALEGVKVPLRLATFGHGGCGFYAPEKTPFLSPPKRVFCTFSLNQTEAIKVQGNLKYVQELSAQGKPIYFYGVEFIVPHRPMVEPIVYGLERLKSEGKIEAA